MNMQQSIQPFSKKAIKRIIKKIPFNKIDKNHYQLIGEFTINDNISSVEIISDCLIVFDVLFNQEDKNKIVTSIKLKQDDDVILLHVGNNDTFEYFLSSIIFLLNNISNEA